MRRRAVAALYGSESLRKGNANPCEIRAYAGRMLGRVAVYIEVKRTQWGVVAARGHVRACVWDGCVHVACIKERNPVWIHAHTHTLLHIHT